MRDAGIAHIGIGETSGDEKAAEAVQKAVTSPLLETTINGAKNVISNITGDVSLFEANEAASYVQELAGEDANIISVECEDTYLMNVLLQLWATGIGEPAKEKTSFSTKMKTNPFASTVAKPKTSTTPMTDYTRNVATAPHGTVEERPQ